jgi:hypothetical protein
MPKVIFEGNEWYPVYTPVTEEDGRKEAQERAELLGLAEPDEWHGGHRIHEVDEVTLGRWRRAHRQFMKMQAEVVNLVDPPCPECGHRTSRHQGWTYGGWGCLHVKDDGGRCRCQYGKPPEGR